MTRPLRDIEAQALREVRLGLTSYGWDSLGEEAKEEWRREADRLDRIRRDLIAGNKPTDYPREGIIESHQLFTDPSKERAIILSGGHWSLTMVDRKTSEQTKEMDVDPVEASLAAGRVLSDDKTVLAIPGIARLLAAGLEIYRLNAGRQS